MAQARRKLEEAGSLDLAALGLDAGASAVYGELLRCPDADAVDIASATHASRASVEASLSQLVRAGLARTASRPAGVEVLRPEAALAQQISLKQRDAVDHVSRLTELREEIADLERIWRRHHRGEVETREFEIVHGLAESNARAASLLHQSRTLKSADQHRDTFEFNEADEERFRRWMRAGGSAAWIDEMTYAAEEGWQASMIELDALGLRARLTQEVPVQFRVYDDSVAVVPLNPQSPNDGLVVCRSAGVVAVLLQLFDELWRRSVDWKAIGLRESAADVEGVDPSLPALLASGSCDDAIARILGVSARTVRRQVANLMHHFAVQSRLQLGVALATSGLLRDRHSVG